ncbi:hypothetical protein [Actinokineospora sp. NBRC 105648]|uniref:hypothetical protein n=1 Tax=Actinokineospora sp. NBRC 105648 TaxID=3032206 RepID=UPI0024A0452A|nr:hypothetical protein [Actinokineospora sp. NBRC 105648]GLZ39046.1 hypothetical protein Acsp05_26700 [Actinokineospora sp. NBRC 105648]
MATEFKFVVDGVDLTDAQRSAIAQAVAEAGSGAVEKVLARDLPYFEFGGRQLRKWELIGKYLLAGPRAHELAEQVEGFIGRQP